MRITDPQQLRDLQPDEVLRRLRPLVRSYVPNWPDRALDRLMEESAYAAAWQVVVDFGNDPTLDGRPATFADFLPAKLQWRVRELDRRQHPHLYDKETDRYLGAEGERVEGLTGDPDSDDSAEAGLGEDWIPHAADRTRKAREDVSDPTAVEALRNVVGPGEQITIGVYLDRVAKRMRSRFPPVPVASQIGVLGLAAQTWANGGEPLGGRPAGKALRQPDYIKRPATAAAKEIADVIGQLIDLGTLKPPSFRFLRDI